MSYAFHDIRHIVQPYLDDLPAHSAKRSDHPTHLREIFLRCRHYRIRLNPHKCFFCVESGRLLGFIVSHEGIRLDPLKVEAIVNLPPPATLQQLQSLQGKANFLRRFVPNYADVAKEDQILDETLFLISTLDPWYGDIIIYLQTSSFRPGVSKDARRRIRHQSQPYRIIGDTLYRLGADAVLRHCLTHEEAERVLNDCHSGACGGHMFEYVTAQKILRAGYFWPSIFKDCILAVRSCHEC
eukprot:PITA_12769